MIFTIFKKELKDTLRDKRTLMMMLVIPTLVFPIIMSLFISISSSFSEEAANKEVKIGYVGNKDNYVINQLNQLPEIYGKKGLYAYTDSIQLKADIHKDTLQMGIYIHTDFNRDFSSKHPAKIKVFYNATNIGMEERAKTYIETIEEIALQERYLELELEATELRPIESKFSNIASDKEMIGKLAGGFLPYIFIAFGFLGCMYPAIDLFTGEKERGTIETLLTTPVARWQILFGKMGVVILSGLVAASASLLGLFISIEVFDFVDNEQLLEIIHGILSVKFIITLFLLLFPLTIFIAGIMIPIAVYAKSFKEAQSIITPLNIIIILPAMVGFFPGIELTAVTACIPIINVVLATKELIAGTLDYSLLGLSFTIMMAFAMLSVFISYKRFDKETNVVL
ncbi:MAG: ABC transporter permease [Crocinitomicaceae bacterium]|nr:ABC transporter permease [Crocinitomicaceae bacterium]MDG1776817.1 ABC transporter permease [Crocinitomicaceae bacterium]